MAQPVEALWYVGRLPAATDRRLAVVGARAASTAKSRLAHDLAASAARDGFAIVSGGALGIDAAAHRGALDAGGATFAVLGCGVDVVYPDRHAALFADVAAAGGLSPSSAPGTPPRGGQFPSRNRIVAALAEAVLVVEARLASGALVTARLARELGRRCSPFPAARAPTGSIADGTRGAVADAGRAAPRAGGSGAGDPRGAAAFAPLMAALGPVPAPAPELARRLGLPARRPLGLIAEAELVVGFVGAPAGRWLL